MKKASNNKKIFIIAIEVIVIVLTFIGVTLATSNIINDNIKVGLKAGDFNVDFKGKSNSAINNNLKGRSKTAYGYHWEYL